MCFTCLTDVVEFAESHQASDDYKGCIVNKYPELSMVEIRFQDGDTPLMGCLLNALNSTASIWAQHDGRRAACEYRPIDYTFAVQLQMWIQNFADAFTRSKEEASSIAQLALSVQDYKPVPVANSVA